MIPLPPECESGALPFELLPLASIVNVKLYEKQVRAYADVEIGLWLC